jgi:dolichol-phosphate mannosyltransferase
MTKGANGTVLTLQEPLMPRLSVVIPFYNEEAVFERLIGALDQAFDGDTEFVLVDDGSRDRTGGLIAAQVERDSRYRGIIFSRNFGHQAAVTAGMDRASGEIVLVMDADLQDPPEAGRHLVERVEAGADVAYGVRKKRKEGLLKRIAYWLYYRMLKATSSLEMPLDAGDFAAMSRRVVDAMKALPERERYPRGLRCFVGFKHEAVAYDRAARAAGETKYDLGRLFRLAYAGLLGFSDAPLRLGFIFAFLYGIAAIAFGIIAIVVGTAPWWIAALLADGFCAISLLLGIIGAYLGRMHLEALGRPTYVIAEELGAQS